jgi:hypothetical protein
MRVVAMAVQARAWPLNPVLPWGPIVQRLKAPAL